MSKINKINVGGTSYDIEDVTKQPLLEVGENITIEGNVISASGGGSEPIILDAGNYNVRRTSNSLNTSTEANGSKLIQEIKEKFSNITETSDVYLRLKVNHSNVGTGNPSIPYVLLKSNYIHLATSSGDKTIISFILFDNRLIKTSIYSSSAYNFQVILLIPYDISSNLNYQLGYNEIQLAGRRYTNATSNNELTMASRDVIFKDDTDAFTPTAPTHPANKGYVDTYLTTLTGYDATKTQVLKNVNGTLQWLDE